MDKKKFFLTNVIIKFPAKIFFNVCAFTKFCTKKATIMISSQNIFSRDRINNSVSKFNKKDREFPTHTLMVYVREFFVVAIFEVQKISQA